jgi:hypothetical protein
MHAAPFESIPQVAEVRRAAGPRAGAAPDLLLEVPHGATRAAHFDDLAGRLRGPLPEGLRDYFFVNTDVGAPELAIAVGERAVAVDPNRSVLVIRSLVPRTLVDCNRVVEPDTGPATSAAGAMTPGIASYLKDPGDLRLVKERYFAYRALVERAYEAVCGAGGLALMVHSYAPREVDVPVDDRIVERLREAYLPERVGGWPLRPEADLITRDPDGRRLADDALVERTLASLARAGVAARADATYRLHPSTMGHRMASRFPGRTLCLEVRRDLLVRRFTPFAEMEADPAKVDRVAAALVEAL